MAAYIPPHARCAISDAPYGMDDFCAAFFHIDASNEANIHKDVCLCNSKTCIRKSVTCIATLSKNGENKYKAVYQNNEYSKMRIHAEILMIHDQNLRNVLVPNACLTLYLTYQPCHFSGGHFSVHKNSCTLSLLRFYSAILAPRKISMVVKVAYIYRAHWTNMVRYSKHIRNARDGIALLKNAGILVESFNRQDWCFVSQQYGDDVASMMKCISVPITTDIMNARHIMDTFIQEYLNSID